jgi:hypothetical protein
MVPRHSLTKHQYVRIRTICDGLGRGFRRALRDAGRRAAGSRTRRAQPPGRVSTFRHKPPPGGGRRVVEGFAIRIRTETPGSVDEREPTVTRFLARWTTRSAATSPTTRAVRPRRDRANCASDRSSRPGEGCRSGRAQARTPPPRRGQPPCMAGARWTLADTPAFNGRGVAGTAPPGPARPRRAASVVEHRRAELTEAMTENG